MAIISSRIAINDVTPTIITIEGREVGTRLSVMVQNLGAQVVYLGGPNLTSSQYSVSIVPGATVTVDDLPPDDELYVLSASGNSYVGVLGIKR